MLRNEKKQTAADRDWMSEMIPFRGCYIYVRDMEERTKPTMIRDYPKPERKELGKWPQLRVTLPSRCPFVEDPPSKRSATLAVARVAEEVKPRTRATTAANVDDARKYLKERPNPPDVANSPAKHTRSRPLAPPRHIPVKRGSTDQLPLYGSAQASLRAAPRFVQGEPVASGVQPSNITSAVRSQMISSTAAVPGAKAGTSRGLNVLKRKVFDVDREGANAEKLQNQVRAALNDEAPRASKRALRDIVEEEEDERKARAAPRKKRVVEKECKPGYCENCREKFEDFDDVSFMTSNISSRKLTLSKHIVSKTHRKFAHDMVNFTELDALLSKLNRI
jgi:regulatory subunit for Cdc7p protein kinase